MNLQKVRLQINLGIAKLLTTCHQKNRPSVPQGVELSPGHENNSRWEGVGQAESVEK